MASNVVNAAKAPELRRRLIFTVVMLAIYRIGVVAIPLPGIDHNTIQSAFGSTSFLKLFDMFSGGALEQMSIFALGVMPYISASIIFQILTVVVPAFEQMQKEGEQGRKKINQYTRYGAVLLSIVWGFFMSTSLFSKHALTGGLGFTLMTVMTLTAGTVFVMWLGEQITERGIGNGTSLIIFSGIVARFPTSVMQLYSQAKDPDFTVLQLVLVVGLVLGVIAVVIFFERGVRKIPIEFPKRVLGGKMYAGQTSHLPMKINVAGVIPPIFASALLLFPAQIADLAPNVAWLQRVGQFLNPGELGYYVVYVPLIIFFCYFYASITMNPTDVAENLRKNGAFVPGIRPGEQTAQYVDRVLARLTFGGAIYISAVCVLPAIFQSQLHVPFAFGGTSLLIVVGVALDTVGQIQQHLMSHNYDQGVALGGLGGAMSSRSLRGRL